MSFQALLFAAAAAATDLEDLRFARHCDAAVANVGKIVLGSLPESDKSDCAVVLRRYCVGASKRLSDPLDHDALQVSDHRFTLAELSVNLLAGHRSFGGRCLPKIAELDSESRAACAESAAFAAGFIPQNRYVLAALVITHQADLDGLASKLRPEGARDLRSDVARLQRMPSSVVERIRMMFARCPYARQAATEASRDPAD